MLDSLITHSEGSTMINCPHCGTNTSAPHGGLNMVSFNREIGTLMYGGRTCRLPPRLIDILEYLLDEPKGVRSAYLAVELYPEAEGYCGEKSIQVAISQFRAILRKAGIGLAIDTTRVGYILKEIKNEDAGAGVGNGSGGAAGTAVPTRGGADAAPHAEQDASLA